MLGFTFQLPGLRDTFNTNSMEPGQAQLKTLQHSIQSGLSNHSKIQMTELCIVRCVSSPSALSDRYLCDGVGAAVQFKSNMFTPQADCRFKTHILIQNSPILLILETEEQRKILPATQSPAQSSFARPPLMLLLWLPSSEMSMESVTSRPGLCFWLSTVFHEDTSHGCTFNSDII